MNTLSNSQFISTLANNNSTSSNEPTAHQHTTAEILVTVSPAALPLSAFTKQNLHYSNTQSNDTHNTNGCCRLFMYINFRQHRFARYNRNVNRLYITRIFSRQATVCVPNVEHLKHIFYLDLCNSHTVEQAASQPASQSSHHRLLHLVAFPKCQMSTAIFYLFYFIDQFRILLE